jgi:hypothetical protein
MPTAAKKCLQANRLWSALRRIALRSQQTMFGNERRAARAPKEVRQVSWLSLRSRLRAMRPMVETARRGFVARSALPAPNPLRRNAAKRTSRPQNPT